MKEMQIEKFLLIAFICFYIYCVWISYTSETIVYFQQNELCIYKVIVRNL